MKFERAVRRKARLRLGIAGPSGSGKTLGALMIAKGIGGRIGVVDTERRSSLLYSAPVRLASGELWEPPEFHALELAPPFTPERYVEAIRAAEDGGFDILIIDSTTHEWTGTGGCLEIVDNLAKLPKYKGNTWAAWSDVTPRHRKFFDAINGSPMHIIATLRSKTETAQEKVGDRTKVVKVGMKSEQRDGTEYEFTIVVDLVHDGHFATASKDRTGVFAGDPQPLSEDTGARLREWLETGSEDWQPPAPQQVDPPPPPPPPPPAERRGRRDVSRDAGPDPRPLGVLMDPNAYVDFMAAIDGAGTLDELKKAHARAVTAARRQQCMEGVNRFDAAKDARKAQLTTTTDRSPS